jgi:hypoxanthine phosphoribosyltransferase
MKADARVPSEAQLSLLFSREAIAARVKELAKQINHDYTGKELLVAGILKGAFVFLADLVRELEVTLEVDFIRAASYGHGTTSSGQVRLTKDLDGHIVGRHVLIVEDILDTGLTLHALLQQLQSRGPASLKVCVLLNKPSRAQHLLKPDYVGFEVSDDFVVGYGIDYAEQYRQLPAIHALSFVAPQGQCYSARSTA